MRLNARGTIDEIVQHAVSRFIADFERLDGALSAALGNEQDSNGEAVRQVWPRTPEEVKVLLS